MKSEEIKKVAEYAANINNVVCDLFDKDSTRYIGDVEDVDLTLFFHAYANFAPCHLYNKLTGSDIALLDFNHFANKLVCQYSKKSD